MIHLSPSEHSKVHSKMRSKICSKIHTKMRSKKFITAAFWMWWIILALFWCTGFINNLFNKSGELNPLPATATMTMTMTMTASSSLSEKIPHKALHKALHNTLSNALRNAPPEFHHLSNAMPAAHSSTVITLANGDLLAAWFAGSREGASDVVISGARFHAGQWSEPTTLMTRQHIARSHWEYNKKVGNPLLFADQKNRVHLIFVSVGLGGWAGSRLNHSVSNDDGQSWSAPKRLYLSPFFNVSTLVRNNISPTSQGFALPVYHELIRKYPTVIWFDRDMQNYQQKRMTSEPQLATLFSLTPNTLQPTLVGTDNQWQVWLRNAFRGKADDISIPQVGYQESNDGKHWSAVRWLVVPNRDSALTVVRVNADTLVMAYNDGEKGSARERLFLASSHNGIDWTPRLWVENQAKGEFSYPSLTVHEGILDLLYTYQRTHIKHLRVGVDWLIAQTPPQSPPSQSQQSP